jgi:putative ABC transport system permease protein
MLVLATSHLAVGAEAVTIAFRPSWSLAGMGVVVAGLVGIVAGLAPGLHAARAEIVPALRA